MRIVFFCQSVLSDWNHGNAHFLRGVGTELAALGHEAHFYEPREGWSIHNLVADHGPTALVRFRNVYPDLRVTRYEPKFLDLDRALEGVDLVIVHEWNEPELVSRIGKHRARTGGYRLLFHDTHHRAVTDPAAMAAYDLRYYDGVLAFGNVLRDLYLRLKKVKRAWTWHEAADTRVFRYIPDGCREGDLVWIGNWGDGERTAELREFLIEPVRQLGLRARAYGVRYPEEARRELEAARIQYCGWLANYDAPAVYARFGATVHVPRRPYTEALRGIPTIRVFEALACGIPLVCSQWDDCEGLFEAGRDYLVAADGARMAEHLRSLMEDEGMARQLAVHGRQTVLARHTCAHRVGELVEIANELGITTRAVATSNA